MENVVITGFGIISALGNGAKSNLKKLQNGVSGIEKIKYLKTKHQIFPVGEVKYSDMEMRKNMELAVVGSIPRNSIFGIAAIREAIISSGIKDKINEIKLITGTTEGGIDIIEDNYLDILTKKEQTADIEFQSARKSTEMICHYTGINFEKSVTISTACSSSLNAIILGARLIRTNKERVVIAGGSESLSKFQFNGLKALQYADKRNCRPFDKDHAGLNLGEGGAYLVMESETDAKKRGAKILAYITGFCNSCDAYHQTTMSPNGEGAYLAMKGALESSGLKPNDIDYINAYGIGVPNIDLSESNAILRLFGEKHPPISSTKGYTGHTMGAAGATEAVLSIIAMHNNFIPNNLGWKNAMNNGFITSKGKAGLMLQHIMVNSFGIGGNDSSIILSSKPTNNWRNQIKSNIEAFTGIEFDEESRLIEITKYTNSLQARKMGRILKASVISSLDILKEHAIECPDAIICCTNCGMLENKEQMMLDIIKNGEDTAKSAVFIQSAYNTVANTLAIMTKCQGYNITYVETGIDSAITDAMMLINEGVANNVLIVNFEETTDFYRKVMLKLDELDRIDRGVRKRIAVQSFLVVKKQTS